MKLSDFPLLADENIHTDVVANLAQRGLDVVSVDSLDLSGLDDQYVLAAAVAQGRVVLTHDADFGRLTVQLRAAAVGIVYLRPGHIRPEFTLATIDAILASNLDLQPPFLLVAEQDRGVVAIRLRQLPMRPA